MVRPPPGPGVVELGDAVGGGGFGGAGDENSVRARCGVGDHADDVDVTDLGHVWEDPMGASDGVTDD